MGCINEKTIEKDKYFEKLIEKSLISKITNEEYTEIVINYKNQYLTNEFQSESNKNIENFKEFIDNLLLFIVNNYLKVKPIKEEANKKEIDKVIVINNYFNTILRLLTTVEMRINYIICLVYVTINTYKTISNSLSLLYSHLKNQTILRKENHFYFINNKLLTESIRLHFLCFIHYSIPSISDLIKIETESSKFLVDIENYYMKVFSFRSISHYIDTYFDFSFIEESSLAYFLKVIYPTFSSIESTVSCLYKCYEETIQKRIN